MPQFYARFIHTENRKKILLKNERGYGLWLLKGKKVVVVAGEREARDEFGGEREREQYKKKL